MFKLKDRVTARINGTEVKGVITDVQTVYGEEWRYEVEYKDKETGLTVKELVYFEEITLDESSVVVPVVSTKGKK